MFVSKKTLKRNNDILFARNSELNKFCVSLQNELKSTNQQLQEKKKECKRLKTLLTKNKISYRKEK